MLASTADLLPNTINETRKGFGEGIESWKGKLREQMVGE